MDITKLEKIVLERRDGIWAATTAPYAITAYGNSLEDALKRVLQMFSLKKVRDVK